MANAKAQDFSKEFAELIPPERIKSLRKAAEAKELTVDQVLDALGDEGIRLLNLGLQLEQLKFSTVMETQKKAARFREWISAQLPDVAESKALAEALEDRTSSEDGDGALDPFPDITRIGTLPFFIPGDGSMLPMLRMEVLSKSKTEASLTVDIEDAMFISLAIARGIFEVFQESRPLAKASLIDPETLEYLETAVQNMARGAERCKAALAELTALHAHAQARK